MAAGTYLVPDSRKKYVDRHKKVYRDSTARLEEVTAFALLANNTPVAIYILNNSSQLQRMSIAIGEAALLSIDTVTQKVSDGSVLAEKVVYTVKNIAGTITLAAIGSAATLVVPTGGSGASANQLILTATAPTNAAYQVVSHIRRVSAFR